MKQNLLEMVQVTVLFHNLSYLMNFLLVYSCCCILVSLEILCNRGEKNLYIKLHLVCIIPNR